MATPQPVFIDFEGIDGSGKTTLSNRLADYLKSQSVPVHHARDKGVFRSKISRAIRDLTRDPSFLRMTDVTELLLYVARDAQMIDEFIRPKLQPGQVVFSDRYLYSAVTHCHHARGLDRKTVDSVVDVAAGGLWPDLVIYCDVDPLTSRVRKKIQKIQDRRLGDFGRKGLMGIGFREEMRNGFLALADEEPEKWLVIDNARSTIGESLQRIFNKVRTILEAKGWDLIPDPLFANLDADTAAENSKLATQVASLLEISDREERQKQAIQIFMENLNAFIPQQSSHAAFYITGLDNPESHEVREKIIEDEPTLVAYGLRGLRSEPSTNFRERLKDREPFYVARSLSGMADDPNAILMREELADVAPEQIALALRGNETAQAWELRNKLKKEAPNEVLLSLRAIDSPEAWEIRDKGEKKKRYYSALLESLGGIDTDRAWELRDRLAEEYMPWVLLSLRGLLSDRAWEWRDLHVHHAPKIIMKTLGRMEHPRAWELRQRAMNHAKEVLDSVSGIETSQAWELRMALRDKWPNTCVSSLGAGNQSERAWNFRWSQLEQYPENLLLLKHIAKAAVRSQEMLAEDYVEDDDEDADFT
jgi:dTMP kinase